MALNDTRLRNLEPKAGKTERLVLTATACTSEFVQARVASLVRGSFVAGKAANWL
jgi:hypothetical protein